MAQIDPFKVMRNTETLQAFRRHQRAVRAAAQPWTTIALIAAVLEIGLFSFELHRHGLRNLGLVSGLLVMASGLSFSIASLRAWLYSRSHPFVLPEAQSASR